MKLHFKGKQITFFSCQQLFCYEDVKNIFVNLCTTNNCVKTDSSHLHLSLRFVARTKRSKTKASNMPGWHSGLMRWLSNMPTNALLVRSQPRTDNFVLSVCCCVLFLASLCYQEHSCMYSYMVELSVWSLSSAC